jgi:hypothetical protein
MGKRLRSQPTTPAGTNSTIIKSKAPATESWIFLNMGLVSK